MCGLNGVYGKLTKQHRDAFNLLSMFSQTRGRHSTGYGLIYENKKRKPKIIKEVGGQESLAFAYPALFDSNWTIKEDGLSCIIGHNRFATRGKVNEENAHPFHHGNVVGCHNGTVYEYMLRDLDSFDSTLTDSEVLIKEISKGQPIQNIIKYQQGAWALVWFDTKKRRLHMIRNKERTLYVALTDNSDTLFWASEKWMLDVALSRAGIKHKPVMAVVKDYHLVWAEEGNKVVLELEEKAEGGQFKTSGWWKPNIFGFGERNKVIPLNPSTSLVSVKQPTSKAGYQFDYVLGYGQKLVGKRAFEKLTEEGCHWCQAPIPWEKSSEAFWYAEEEILCKECGDYCRSDHKFNMRN